jgi:hypothetical protein
LTLADLDLRYPYFDPRYDQMAFSDSYFDGASTTLELLAASVLRELARDRPELAPVVRYKSLTGLYISNYHRQLDSEFMAGADALGLWIRTPFPAWQVNGKFRPRPNALEIDSVSRLCQWLRPVKPAL